MPEPRCLASDNALAPRAEASEVAMQVRSAASTEDFASCAARLAAVQADGSSLLLAASTAARTASTTDRAVSRTVPASGPWE